MQARRVELSIPIEQGTLADPELVVPVFHGFIREGALGELLIDVARYGHVSNAPAVVLVGHASDYRIDVGAEGLRLCAVRKRDAAAPERRLRDVAERLSLVARLLEEALPGLRFRTDEFRLRLLDRLQAPNTPESFRRVSQEVGVFARQWLGEVRLEPGTDSAAPLEVRIRRTRNEPVAELARGLT